MTDKPSIESDRRDTDLTEQQVQGAQALGATEGCHAAARAVAPIQVARQLIVR
jgi:hypothetical protein